MKGGKEGMANGGILRANVKKLLIVMITYIIITSIISLILIVKGNSAIELSITGLVFAPVLMLGYIFLTPGCYYMSTHMFDHLMKRDASDFYSVLPYKRKTMFMMNILAMYVVIVFVLLVNALIVFVSGFFVRSQMTIIWKDSFKYMLAAAIAMILIINISSFAMVCSGNKRTALLMTVLLVVGPRFLVTSIAYTGDNLNGAMHIVDFVRILNPDINIISRACGCIFKNEFDIPGSMQNVSIWMACAYTAGLAFVYYKLGERVYVHHKSEDAGKGKVGKVTYWFNRVFLGVIMMHTSFLKILVEPELEERYYDEYEYDTVYGQLVLFAVITLIVLSLYDAYIGRKGKRFRRFCISVIAVIAGLLAVACVVYGIRSYEDNYWLDPKKIEAYNLTTDYFEGEWFKPSDKMALQIKESFDARKNDVEAIYSRQLYGSANYYDDYYYNNGEYSMLLKYNGRIVRISYYDKYYLTNEYNRKTYDLPKKITRYNGKVVAIVNNADYKVDISPKLYEVFRKEYFRLSDEEKEEVTHRSYNVGNENANITIICDELVDGISRVKYIQITDKDFPETYAYVWKRYTEKMGK